MFVESIGTLGATPPSGADDLGDRYANVLPGTRVAFRVALRNELFEREVDPQFFYLRVVLRGDGVTRLRETVVQIVVPSLDGEGCPVIDG